MSSDVTSSHSVSQLEFPMPERLLPVGPQRDQISSLVEDVRQILSAPENQGKLPNFHTIFSKTNIQKSFWNNFFSGIAKQTGTYKDDLQNVKQDSVGSENAASEVQFYFLTKK